MKAHGAYRTSLVAQTVKCLSTMRETRVQSLGQKICWRRKWQSTPVLLPGKSHGQRSLVGYSPWGRKEWIRLRYFTFTFTYSRTSLPGGSVVKNRLANAGDMGSIPGLGRSSGEGNGNPLQYSCLENPMDRGAWQATVHGVTKSQTQLSNFTSLFTKCILSIFFHKL